MTLDSTIRRSDETRRSVLKYTSLGATALALGAVATTGAAGTQDDESDGETSVVLFGDEYRPGVDFDVLLTLGTEPRETLFDAVGLTDEFSTPEDWDVHLVAFDAGGSAPILAPIMTADAPLGAGDSGRIGPDASFRNAELNLIETTVAAPADEEADGGAAPSGEDYPAVDEWLTESEVGAAAPNYDGTIVDRRGQETITVGVGTGPSGWRFGPPAVAVAPGTTVRWEWTGQGGAHNVEAEPEDQIGESDYEYSSGEPVSSGDATYEQTFDDPGIALYHCEPHLAVGMKGAIVIVE